MSKFLKWVDDDGYTSDGKRRYSLALEQGIDQPRWWDVWRIDSNGHYRKIAPEFYHPGWMTKARAKAAAEAHYVATHSNEQEPQP